MKNIFAFYFQPSFQASSRTHDMSNQTVGQAPRLQQPGVPPTMYPQQNMRQQQQQGVSDSHIWNVFNMCVNFETLIQAH